MIAAGRCNHAGKGSWKGVANGNSNFIGIEAQNTGLPNDFPWPIVQIDAYHHGVAAILKHINQTSDFCAGHKEYATPHGRKSDPDFDMGVFRSTVAAIMKGTIAPITPIPVIEPSAPGAPLGRPTVRRGATGKQVKMIQKKVGVTADGDFGPKTEAAVRAFQRKHGLVPDGIVGPKTWGALDGVAMSGSPGH